MNLPERSEAIARALAEDTTGLPADFAAQVAALAEAESAQRWTWNDAALLVAFVAMIGVCVAGWFTFGAVEIGTIKWWEPIVSVAAAYPWLAVGVAGVVIVQVLNFRRRALPLARQVI
jgi:hypothetical protein